MIYLFKVYGVVAMIGLAFGIALFVVSAIALSTYSAVTFCVTRMRWHRRLGSS